jgi:hypothetical protein
MTVETFKSQWGDYTVTKAVLRSPIKVYPDGAQFQDCVYFESTDISETVQTVIKGRGKRPDGTLMLDNGWGIRKAMLKPSARDMWRKYIAKGYSTEVPELM